MTDPADTLLAPDPVSAEENGLRLDKWLSARLPHLSRTRVKGLIDDGRVRTTAQTITDASARVKPGQSFTVAVPPDRPADPQPQAMELAVAYEDDDLIVVDKPAGLVVHPAPGSPDHTLVNALLAHCGESLSGIGGVKRPGIVHRIDKDTSGLLVVAKNDRAHHGLAEQFAVHSLERVYRALVWGVPLPAQGEIAGAIGRSSQDRKKMAVVSHGGKPALTRYRVLRSFAGGAVSLVECRLATGRTHQIRVHMTAIGHPLVGDQTYGRSRAAKMKAVRAARRPPFRAKPCMQPYSDLTIRFLGSCCGSSEIPMDINELIAI